MHCPHCHQEHPDTARFCPVTGQAIPAPEASFCTTCGSQFSPSLQYCPNCGAPQHLPTKKPFNPIYLGFVVLGVVVMALGGYLILRNNFSSIFTSLSGQGNRGSDSLLELASPSDEDVTMAAYSPDGTWLALATGEQVALYQVHSGVHAGNLETGASVTSLAFSPQGDQLAVGLQDGRVQVWRIPEGALLFSLDDQSDPVSHLAFAADGHTLAFATSSGFIFLCQALDGQVLRVIETRAVHILCLAVSPDGYWLAACTPDTFQVWRDGKLQFEDTLPEGAPNYLAYSPDGVTLAAASSQGIYRWRVADGRALPTVGNESGEYLLFSPNSRYILCVCGGNLEVYDTVDSSLVKVYGLGRYDRIPAVAYSTRDGFIAASLLDGRVRSWATGAYPQGHEGVSAAPTAVAAAGDSQPTTTPALLPTDTARPQPSPTPLPPLPTNTPLPTHTPLPTNTPMPTFTPVLVNEPIALAINEIDSAEIVFVPEGPFTMGTDPDTDKYYWGAEAPQHRVNLDAFWIYRTEVTNGMYQACVADKACPKPDYAQGVTTDEYYGNPDYDNYPVIYVTYTHALAYCVWAGGKLPTEAQWEKAARGDDGRLFPWGNEVPTDDKVNLCDANCAGSTERVPSIHDGYPGPAPVGSYPQGASPYGAYDMAGNVWEWVFDWFNPLYYNSSPVDNPRGPASGTTRTFRGGGWNNEISGVRTVVRSSMSPNKSLNGLGFRCVVENP